MQTRVLTSAISAFASTKLRASGAFPARVLGLAIVSIGPALFWVGVLAFISHLIGRPFSSHTLALTGGAIGLFLAVVCAPFILRRERDQE